MAPMPGTPWTVSEFVFAKLAFDEFVQIGDLLVEGHHVPDRGVVCPAEDRQLIVLVLTVGNRRDVHSQVP
ncbi:hypothetical protein ACIF9R_12200 [Streptomyces sp. NPDC086080]|uniref:hypothetical protein n=1 Tax=Streptomyces sp. NPDC086080 TaxID=3365748 RepID=UPI0037D11D46